MTQSDPAILGHFKAIFRSFLAVLSPPFNIDWEEGFGKLQMSKVVYNTPRLLYWGKKKIKKNPPKKSIFGNSKKALISAEIDRFD